MEYSSLYDLITQLTFGTKLHIGVLFFGNRNHPLLMLPQRNQIHASPICDVCKQTPEGMNRCFRCRNAAIKRALHRKKPFAAPCINGIYEYTRPVTEDGQVLCIIYIGNILPQGNCAGKILETVGHNSTLLQTLQPDISLRQCETIGKLLESYIRMTLQVCPAATEESSTDHLVENIKAFLNANLEYDVTVRQLAELFHYSSKYLGRLFKQRSGQTVAEYVNARRLEQARKLLVQASHSVVDISFRVGFNHVTYFNRLFQQRYHMTPLEYRHAHGLPQEKLSKAHDS